MKMGNGQISHWTSVILNRGKALILPHHDKSPVYPAPVRVFPLRRDLSRPGVHRVRRSIHQRGSPPHGRGNGLGIQRFHTGLRDFRDSERVAWRHDWPQESADANCLMEIGEHTSELQSHVNLVCRLLLEKKKIQRSLLLAAMEQAMSCRSVEPKIN